MKIPDYINTETIQSLGQVELFANVKPICVFISFIEALNNLE